MPNAFSHHASSRPRHVAWLVALFACLFAGSAVAVDAALNWASLSGEQQYILARFAPRWAQLDLAARGALLARAEAHRLQARQAASVASEATPKKPAAPRSQSVHRRRSLSAAEAGMSAHSFRLRRVLRELPGLSSNERGDLLARWGGLSNSQRVRLVDRYMHNFDDDEALSLQQALRGGKISHEDLQRGLASGKLEPQDVKAALAAGSISAKRIQEGVASHKILAEDLETVLREGNIDSEDLNNAIEHHRTLEGAAADAGSTPASGDTLPP